MDKSPYAGRRGGWQPHVATACKGGEYSVITIKVKKGEQIEKAIKRLKKSMDKEGIIKQIRAERYFEKPSERKRKKSARARSRARSLARRAALAEAMPHI